VATAPEVPPKSNEVSKREVKPPEPYVSQSTAAAKAPTQQTRKIDLKETLTGTWQQFFYDPGREAWVSGGVYQVFTKDNELRMSITETWTAPSDSTRSLGISNIDFDGQYWTFNSRWDVGLIAIFKLKKIDDNTFEGHSSVEGRPERDKNRWVRLK